MRFFLMRHGEAEYSAPSDRQRKLTAQGVELIQKSLSQYADFLTDVDCIIHSPYIRACQTAELAVDSLNPLILKESAVWTPDADPRIALESLAEYVEFTPLIITHMPLVSYVEALCCEDATTYPRPFSCAEISEVKAEWPAAGLGNLIRRF